MQTVRHSGSLCDARAACVTLGQPVRHTRAACVTLGQPVWHSGSVCDTRATCVTLGQTASHSCRLWKTIPATYLSDELNNLDEDVEGRVPGHNSLRSFGEQGVDDAGEAGVGSRVTLALDADHVHPQQAVKGLCQGKEGENFVYNYLL